MTEGLDERAHSPFASRRERRAAERLAESVAAIAVPVFPAPQPPTPVVDESAGTALEPTTDTVELGVLPATPIERNEDGAPIIEVVIKPAEEPRKAVKAKAHRPKSRKAPHSARNRTSRRHPVARGIFSAVAMVSAAGLAIGLSLPATATFTATIPVAGAEAAASEPEASTLSAPAGQQVELDSTILGGTVVGGRDEFTGQSFADSQRAYYQAAGRLFHPTFIPTAGAIRWPFPNTVAISAPYGYSSSYAFGWHDGVDFIPGYGAEVQAIADGVVTWVGSEGALGYAVHIQHKVGGQTVESIYGHMISGSSTLYPGQTVSVGTIVGLTGETGQATGPHLHLGLKIDGEFTDPYVWLSMNATNRQ